MKHIVLFLIIGTLALLAGCEQKNELLSTQNGKSSDEALPDINQIETGKAQPTEADTLKDSVMLKAAKVQSVEFVVPDQYRTIQAAVNAAPYGARIIVKSGDYKEVVTLRGGLTLVGESRPKVTGFKVNSYEDIVIAGFNINNPYGDGVQLLSAARITVKDNVIRGYKSGLSVLHTIQSVIEDNDIRATASSGRNIYLEGSHGIRIEDNEATDRDRGIGMYLSKSNSNKIISNDLSGNSQALVLVTSSRNEITKNKCDDSRYNGITVLTLDTRLFSSLNVIGPENSCEDNGQFGIVLHAGARSNTVTGNTARDNEVCDLVDAGVGNLFVGNEADCLRGVNQR